MTIPDTPSTDAASARQATREHAAALTAAAVMAVLTLHVVTLVALYTGTQPHPPFVLAPFIAANVAVGVAAVTLLRRRMRAGFVAAIGFAAVSIISFGPHKMLAENALAILPAALVGFAASCIAIRTAYHHIRTPDEGAIR